MINTENLLKVIQTADFLQLDLIEDPNFIRGDLLSKENVFEVMKMVQSIYSARHLKKHALQALGEPKTLEEVLLFARCTDDIYSKLREFHEGYQGSLQNNFIKAITDPDFLLIDNEPELCMILDPLFAKKKEWHPEIFRALLRWINFKKGREEHVDLFRYVWIDTMPQDTLKNEVLPALKEISDDSWFMEQVALYTESSYEIPCFHSVLSIGPGCYGNRYLSQRVLVGYVQPVMYVFGGRGHTIQGTLTDGFAFCQEITDPELYDDEGARPEGHTHDLGYWPINTGFGQMELKGDSVGCFAFIAGGFTQDKNEVVTASDQFFRYQMLTGETLPLANIPRATYWHEVVINIHSGEVWVLGGVVQEGRKNIVTKSTYIYDTMSNKWKSGPDLPRPLCLFGACCTPISRWKAFLNNQPKHLDMLISGGTTTAQGRKVRSSVTSNAYLYKTEASTWEKLPSMNFPRYAHSMASFCDDDEVDQPKNEFYVLGGKGRDEQYLESIEILQLDIRQWTVLTRPSFKKAMFGLFTRRWKAELITFSEDDDGQTVMQILSSLPEIHRADWNDVATIKLPFSLKGTLVLPCFEEIRLQDPPPGVTVEQVTCSTCNLGPSAFHLAEF